MKAGFIDQQLIDLVRQRDALVMTRIYKKYRLLIYHYVISNGGNLQDAQDIYQEVMLAFYANMESGKLTCLHGRLGTYLHKLAQNLWHTYLRRHEPLRGASDLIDYPVEQPADESVEEVPLHELISALDTRCHFILHLYYFEGLPMQEVAQRVGLSCAESARKRKCDCLEKLKALAAPYRLLETSATR